MRFVANDETNAFKQTNKKSELWDICIHYEVDSF